MFKNIFMVAIRAACRHVKRSLIFLHSFSGEASGRLHWALVGSDSRWFFCCSIQIFVHVLCNTVWSQEEWWKSRFHKSSNTLLFNVDSTKACVMFTIPHLAWILSLSVLSKSNNVEIYSVFRWRKEVIRIQWVAANRILVIVQIKGVRILSHSTVRWVSRALIRFSFIGLLR